MILKDAEDIIDDMIDALNNVTYGLNAQIALINTQKSAIDTARGRVVMVLDKFITAAGAENILENDNLFFFMQQEFINNNPFMVISIPTFTTDEMGSENITVTFTILVEDADDGTDAKRKLLRYTRAIRETLKRFLNQSGDFINAAKLMQIEPDFNLVFANDEVKSYYSAGVSCNFVFA